MVIFRMLIIKQSGEYSAVNIALLSPKVTVIAYGKHWFKNLSCQSKSIEVKSHFSIHDKEQDKAVFIVNTINICSQDVVLHTHLLEWI